MAAQLWEVVGGAKTGGVVVRSGKDLKSQEAPERLATGAVVEEVELLGQRLHFKLHSGKGPDTGWVTVQSKDATLLSRRAQMDGSEVWIVTNGSRGDIQPFLALARGLQRAGSKVRLFTSRDHGPFVESLGVEFTGVCDGQDFLRRSWMELLPEQDRKAEEEYGMVLWQGRVFEGDKLIIKEFASTRPDVLVCGHMHHGLRLVAQRGFGVRSRLAHIAYESFETWTDLWFRYERTCAFDRSLAREGFLSEPVLQDMSFVDFCRDLTSAQTLNAVTSLYCENLTPVDKEIAAGVKFTGNWVLRPGTSDEFFGGTDAQKELQRFLDAGSPPVYIGWGSCTPFGGDLQAAIFSAVLALQANSLRAVVLGGFASLDSAVLTEAVHRFDPPGLTKVQAYAAANLLFIASAPHEWLLPRCVATLHHGGAGTTAAALRAGVPTLIMPCGYDQFQSARWVEQLGCGLQVLVDENFTWQALSKAMRRAKSDEAMRARARTVAETLRREPGVDAAIAELQRSIKEPPPAVEPARAPRHLARFFRYCSKRLEERRKSGVKAVNTTFQIKGDSGSIVLDLKRGEVRWGEDAAADCTLRMPDVAFQCFCCSWGVNFDVEFDMEQLELLEVLKEEFSLRPLPKHWREVADAFTELDEEK